MAIESILTSCFVQLFTHQTTSQCRWECALVPEMNMMSTT